LQKKKKNSLGWTHAGVDGVGTGNLRTRIKEKAALPGKDGKNKGTRKKTTSQRITGKRQGNALVSGCAKRVKKGKKNRPV